MSVKPGDRFYAEIEVAGYWIHHEFTVMEVDSVGNVKVSAWIDKKDFDELET